MAGFGLAVRRHHLPFDLVTVGVGHAQVPSSLEHRIVDLGYLAPAEVPDAFAAAAAFVQPSANESFSRTIMEAWLAETIVIASGASDVVTWHCERSGGGLVYADELELGQCLRFVAEAPEQAARTCPQGARLRARQLQVAVGARRHGAFSRGLAVRSAQQRDGGDDGDSHEGPRRRLASPAGSWARAEALREEVVGCSPRGTRSRSSRWIRSRQPTATWPRGGIPGCMRLATMVPGFDSVIVQVQPGLPVRERAGQLERELSLVALSFALRRARHVVIRLECPDDLPGGPGGRAALRLWHSAERIVVGGDDRTSGLCVCARQHRRSHWLLILLVEHAADTVDADDGGWDEGADVAAENVLELVRKRAARERRELAASGSARFAGWDRLAVSGIALTELDSNGSEAPEAPRGLGDRARSVLAFADRQQLLRPGVRAVRVGYRIAKAALGPQRSD